MAATPQRPAGGTAGTKAELRLADRLVGDLDRPTLPLFATTPS